MHQREVDFHLPRVRFQDWQILLFSQIGLNILKSHIDYITLKLKKHWPKGINKQTKSGLACLLSFPSTIQSSCDAGEREPSLGLGERIYSYSFLQEPPLPKTGHDSFVVVTIKLDDLAPFYGRELVPEVACKSAPNSAPLCIRAFCWSGQCYWQISRWTQASHLRSLQFYVSMV